MADYGSNKREAPDYMDNPEGSAKRARGGENTTDVRILVKSKNAGAIIGKGGSNINRLRTGYKASVTVPDCSGPERILSIVSDTDTIGTILLDVIPKLDEYSDHDNMDFECELRMLVHQSHAGCLIGKGGSRIKEVREKTGAQIKIFSNCCPDSSERVVLITGVPKVAVSCVREVCDIISQSPVKGPNRPYDPHNFDPNFANEYGGYEDTMQKGRGRGSFRGGRGASQAWRDDTAGNFSFNSQGGATNRGPGFFGSYSGGGGGGDRMGANGGGRWNQGGGGVQGGNAGLLGRPGWGDDNTGGGGYEASPAVGGYRASPGGGGYGATTGGGGYGASTGMGYGALGGRDRMPNSQNGSGLLGQGFGNAPRADNAYTGFHETNLNSPASHFMASRQDNAYTGTVAGTGELFSAQPISNPDGSALVTMKIPNEVAGAIIGKGGQRIRKIRRDSAATINIEESTSGNNDRIIKITGSYDQVSSAQYLMQQSAHENPPNRRF